MNLKLIDNPSEIPPGLNLNDLMCLNHSGRAYNITGSNDFKKKYRYRSGIITPSGDIELSIWQEAVRRIAAKTDNCEMLNNLREWVEKEISFCKTKDDIENEALELYSMSIWEDTEWVDYAAFREKYIGVN